MKLRFYGFEAAGLLGALLLVGGCGDDVALPANAVNTTAIPVASVVSAPVGSPVGSIAVAPGRVVTATPANSSVPAVTILSGVVITPAPGTTFSTTTPPVLVVTTPLDGATTGVPPVVSSSGAAVAITGSAGAVDISIQGVPSFTLGGAGATVSVPVATAPSTPIKIFSVKSDGKAGAGSPYTGTYDSVNKVVNVTGVKDFCWFVVNPITAATTGSGGGTPIN